jgi:hypothetical protein
VRHELIWPDGRPHSEIAPSGQQSPVLSTGAAKGDRRAFRVLDGGRKED